MNQTIKNELIIFLTLTKRHLLLFFKNKMIVFYTLLVPIIILGVYVFFLRDLELSNILGSVDELLKDSELNANDPSVVKYIETIIDSWMLSGIISLSTLTVSLQTNNIFVEDKENGMNRDFISSISYLFCSKKLNMIIPASDIPLNIPPTLENKS